MEGVEANATERAVRGETRTTKRDGIHRAMLRGGSTHMRARADAVARELAAGGLKREPGRRILLETRRAVIDGWRGLADVLERDGNPQLAGAVRRFVEMMPPAVDRERENGASDAIADPRPRGEGASAHAMSLAMGDTAVISQNAGAVLWA